MIVYYTNWGDKNFFRSLRSRIHYFVPPLWNSWRRPWAQCFVLWYLFVIIREGRMSQRPSGRALACYYRNDTALELDSLHLASACIFMFECVFHCFMWFLSN